MDATLPKLTQPAYFYVQYQDDLELKALINAVNDLYQEYVDAFWNAQLPVFTNFDGLWLDWIAEGIYGHKRPVIATGEAVQATGSTFLNLPFKSFPFLAMTTGQTPGYQTVDDDGFKRVLMWHLYKGDGERWSILWLKRRIKRFISDFFVHIDDTSDISISLPVRRNQIGNGSLFPAMPFRSYPFLSWMPSDNPIIDSGSVWTIDITATDQKTIDRATLFKWLVKSNKLVLNVQNRYEVLINGA